MVDSFEHYQMNERIRNKKSDRNLYKNFLFILIVTGLLICYFQAGLPTSFFTSDSLSVRVWKSYNKRNGTIPEKIGDFEEDDLIVVNTTRTNIANTSATQKTQSQPEQNRITDVDDVSPLKEKQIQSYLNGTGLVLSIHITHHAGTWLCNSMKIIGPVPSFSCMVGDDWPANVTTTKTWGESYNETQFVIQNLRPYYHFVAQEYSDRHRGTLYHSKNWENENLVSVIVMRHPLDRFLAGGKCGDFHENGGFPLAINMDALSNSTPKDDEIWWQYANSKCADNYALRILTSNDTSCCDEDSLQSAKNMLKRFTFILDQDCLDDSIDAMKEILNMTEAETKKEDGKGSSGRGLFDFFSGSEAGYHDDFYDSDDNHIQHVLNTHNKRNLSLHHVHKSARERIVNDTLWEFLNHRFRHDIELYEWSKRYSIVQC